MMACTKRSYRKKKKQPSCRPLLLRQNKSSVKASVNTAPSHAVFCEPAGGLVLTDVRDYSRIRKNGPSDELVKLLASRL